MKVLPMPAHASRYLDAQPMRRSISDRTFVWLMQSSHPEARLLRVLGMPFVVFALLLAELADAVVLAVQQLAWLTADGFWTGCYRIFIAFALSVSVAILAVSFYVLLIQ